MLSTNEESNKLYETLSNQALDLNSQSIATWSKYKNDLDVTKSLLASIPQKVKHDVMVPIGPKALMRGTIVHTNEFLVNLGETWFVKRTAYQATEICNRRIKTCDEMLNKLEKERQLVIDKNKLPVEQDAFGSEERSEIIEYQTEEEDRKWREEHREKEKKYRQELAKLRNQEKKPIQTEEDLWNHLDELELQEELEDELNRLNSEDSSDENEKETCESDEKENNESKLSEEKKNPKRKVSFVCDFESPDDEPLRLEIKHTPVSSKPKATNPKEINTPSDIYTNYLNLINKEPLSVLKNQNSFDNYIQSKPAEISDDDDDDESNDEFVEESAQPPSGAVLKDVLERKVSETSALKNSEIGSKKVSKFKQSRLKPS